MENKKLNDRELEQINGGFIPPYPPAPSIPDEAGSGGPFDGSGKIVPLSPRPDPQDHDRNGPVSASPD